MSLKLVDLFDSAYKKKKEKRKDLQADVICTFDQVVRKEEGSFDIERWLKPPVPGSIPGHRLP